MEELKKWLNATVKHYTKEMNSAKDLTVITRFGLMIQGYRATLEKIEEIEDNDKCKSCNCEGGKKACKS